MKKSLEDTNRNSPSDDDEIHLQYLLLCTLDVPTRNDVMTGGKRKTMMMSSFHDSVNFHSLTADPVVRSVKKTGRVRKLIIGNP